MRFVVLGAAGFIGSNLCHALLRDGHQVTVFDSLARKGAQKNLAWLKGLHGDACRFIQDDVRDANAVAAALRNADVVYHLAAQVAVTTSVAQPREDFEINALGTLNVLEAARALNPAPTVIFTSTNKVYGALESVSVVADTSRYVAPDFPHGIAESHRLDFHSPYGCSKGAADQYVRDYARIYNLPTVVFRMSCIYGPRQFGTEDQGWVAHFLISALQERPITIYGNGKQVRDVLYVDDLVRALRLAAERIETTRGQVYNIGGGASNSISIWAEFSEMLTELTGRQVAVLCGTVRPGDQPYYVSDIRKVMRDLNWRPQVSKDEGVRRLFEWVWQNRTLFEA